VEDLVIPNRLSKDDKVNLKNCTFDIGFNKRKDTDSVAAAYVPSMISDRQPRNTNNPFSNAGTEPSRAVN